MRDIRSIKAAVFDLDGTLLDSTAAWEGLGERYLAGRGITPEPGLDEKLRCMALPDGSAYLKSAYSLPEPPDEILRDILRGIEEFSEGDFIDADEADRLIRAEKGWL